VGRLQESCADVANIILLLKHVCPSGGHESIVDARTTDCYGAWLEVLSRRGHRNTRIPVFSLRVAGVVGGIGNKEKGVATPLRRMGKWLGLGARGCKPLLLIIIIILRDVGFEGYGAFLPACSGGEEDAAHLPPGFKALSWLMEVEAYSRTWSSSSFKRGRNAWM
jgi:hypothetical protein